ncbi:septum formation initiator family protein [Flavobacteriaceae bacterium]|jgi:cell division protein DivIC|nr:septum formation initiator family protein [Flavobacteriaceae bacterium]MDC0571478.1 septum formation initiator family protein [Flavobacteriaceae bacterium]|tara:strand:- start:598 stop:909 length:312 start_codon:yes stop_codon:yes gene_type:complete
MNRLKNIFKPFKNIFLLVTIIFIVWMLFFDANSWLIQRELNKEIDALNVKKEFYESEISSDKKEIKILQTPEGVEKYAREKYNMKKENEDIYIIETDSIKPKE